MYLKPAGSDAGLCTIVVYARAPTLSSVPRTSAIVEPSSMPSELPRTTTPISRTSRLSAIPRTPFSNSSSSLAIADGKPSTRAMPSPEVKTVPTSSREVADGLKSATNWSSAARISSGLIVSSAMSGCLPSLRELTTGRFEAPSHRSVDDFVADLDPYPADEARVDDDHEVDRTFHLRGERRLEPSFLIGGERVGHDDRRQRSAS